MKSYRAEYANGATEDFEAHNDYEALRLAVEIGHERNHLHPYAVFLLDEDGNEIKRI